MAAFEDDDAAYLTWAARHPQGYVLRTAVFRGTGYLVSRFLETFHIVRLAWARGRNLADDR